MGDRRMVALVGGESLLGAEMRDVFRDRFPGIKVRLVGSEEDGTAILTAEAGEAVVMTGLDGDTLAGAGAIVLAGSVESSRKALEMLYETVDRADDAPAIVDATHAFEEEPEVRVRAPIAEPALPSLTRLQGVAHPAAIVLAAFLRHLHKRIPVTRSVAQILLPVSEFGRPGVSELQRQTAQLLTFQKQDRAVFDDQIAFNLLARYGLDAKVSVSSIEKRIERHLASLLSLSPPVPMPSLRAIQAPVMHGLALSVWVEFVETPHPLALTNAIQSAYFDVRGPETEAPSPVNAAGMDGVTVGAVEADRNHSRAAWFWLAADNFRIVADNAALLVEAILEA